MFEVQDITGELVSDWAVLREVGNHVLVHLTLNNVTGFITMPHIVLRPCLSYSGASITALSQQPISQTNSLTVVYVLARKLLKFVSIP